MSTTRSSVVLPFGAFRSLKQQPKSVSPPSIPTPSIPSMSSQGVNHAGSAAETGEDFSVGDCADGLGSSVGIGKGPCPTSTGTSSSSTAGSSVNVRARITNKRARVHPVPRDAKPGPLTTINFDLPAPTSAPGQYADEVAALLTKKCELRPKTLVVIRGLPGSGKTYLAEALMKALPFGSSGVICENADYYRTFNGGYYQRSDMSNATKNCADSVSRAVKEEVPLILVTNPAPAMWQVGVYAKQALFGRYHFVLVDLFDSNGLSDADLTPRCDSTIRDGMSGKSFGEKFVAYFRRKHEKSSMSGVLPVEEVERLAFPPAVPKVAGDVDDDMPGGSGTQAEIAP